jgi:predicted enzyme related to lactoylglutathione lyase
MTVSLQHVTFDSANAAELAGFWSEVLEQPVDDGASEYFATIGLRGPAALRPAWMFIKVPEGKTAKNRMHIDLGTDDLEADIARVVDLGAKHVGDFAEFGTRWASFRDPGGNEFDIGTAME